MDPSTLAPATNKLLELGLPGVIIVILLAVCAALWKAYSSANEARIKEGDENTAKYVGLLEKVMSSMNDTNTVLQIIKDRMGSRKE